ncbi:MAG: threonine synthase [Chloroflexota bacterium]|nr:threonine synthase [Chloroflexota bacterium]
MYQLVCRNCQKPIADRAATACPQDGGILDVRYTSPQIPVDSALPGIWRYAARLPLDDSAHIVSLGEGGTPLLPSAHLGAAQGLDNLYFKNESLNPTGSYKDRISSVGISQLVEQGKDTWVSTSSGNAGASTAAYGVRAGVKGYLFTLERAPRAKIGQIIAYGPTLRSVRGLGYDPAVEDATWANCAQLCQSRGWMMTITACSFSPLAMEGAKTIAYEICEALGNAVPDVVYVPVGGGGLLTMIYKGFQEWRAAGYIDRAPRMVSVQALGCDAVTQAWEKGSSLQALDDCASMVSGIILTNPPDGELVLEALRDSSGWAVSVSDDATYQAQEELANREGLFVEPAAAVTWGAIKADRQSGRLKTDDVVVAVLTGVGFKDSAAIQRMTEHVDLPLIEANDILTVDQSAPG